MIEDVIDRLKDIINTNVLTEAEADVVWEAIEYLHEQVDVEYVEEEDESLQEDED